MADGAGWDALGAGMSLDGLPGEEVEGMRCTSCSGRYCGRRSVRIVDGKPLAVCTASETAMRLLAPPRLPARANELRHSLAQS